MLKKDSTQTSELQDLLDSDDELPTNYNEKPDLPAYLDDERFDPIQFTWIKKIEMNKIQSISAKPVPPPSTAKAAAIHKSDGLSPATRTCKERNLIKTGILNEQDILCMKSVAARSTDDSALLWFIDFLMYKDLQANYTFLKSCLVVAQEYYGGSRNPCTQIFTPQTLNNCFDLIIK